MAEGKKIILYAPTFRGRVAQATAPDELDIKKMAEKLSDEYEVVVRYEELKSHIRSFQDKQKSKYNFFRPLYSELSLSEHIRDLKQSFEKIGDIVKK